MATPNFTELYQQSKRQLSAPEQEAEQWATQQMAQRGVYELPDGSYGRQQLPAYPTAPTPSSPASAASALVNTGMSLANPEVPQGTLGGNGPVESGGFAGGLQRIREDYFPQPTGPESRLDAATRPVKQALGATGEVWKQGFKNVVGASGAARDWLTDEQNPSLIEAFQNRGVQLPFAESFQSPGAYTQTPTPLAPSQPAPQAQPTPSPLFTEAQQAISTPQAEAVDTVPQVGGSITRGGETTYFGQGGGQIDPSEAQLANFQQRSQDVGNVSTVTGTPAPLAASAQQNIAEGRAPNVSAAQAAERQAITRQQARSFELEQATDEFRKSRGLGNEPSPQEVAEFRNQVLAQQSLGAQEGGTPQGLSVSDQIALRKEGRESRKEIRAEEAAQQSQSQALTNATTAAQNLTRQFSNIDELAQTTKGQALAPFTTGLGGALMSLKPGSTASDLRANLDTLKADSAFSSLQAMRDASPTGGALGAISEGELKLLGSSLRALTADQSNPQLVKNINSYIELRNRMMTDARKRFAQDFGEAAAAEAFGETGGQGSQSSGIPNDRNVVSSNEGVYAKYQ